MEKQPKSLYLGLDPSRWKSSYPITHYPIIKTAIRSYQSSAIQKAFSQLFSCSHLLFTSRTAVSSFFKLFQRLQTHLQLPSRLSHTCVVVGRATAQKLREYEIKKIITSDKETAEGLIETIEALPMFSQSSFFWPHSSLSRPILREFFTDKEIPFIDCEVYDTICQKPQPLPNLDEYAEIVFTSPSTVKAFLQIFSKLPQKDKIKAIGPITKRALFPPS